MAYDDIFEYIGSFGPYQRRIYILQTLPIVMGAMQTLLPVFILYTPDHRCSLPSWMTDSFGIDDHFHESLINQSVRRGKGHEVIFDEEIYSKCKVFKHVHLNSGTVSNESQLSKTVHYDHDSATDVKEDCHAWVYDKKTFESTFVTESNLVCSRKMYRTYPTMAYFGGYTIGSVVIGALSDVFGRKKGLLLSFFLHISSNIPLGFVKDYHVFTALRFISGVSSAGMTQNSFVMNMELVGPDTRMIAGMILHISCGVGLLLLNLEAYLIRDWKTLNLVISAPSVFFLLYIWILPESARWLMNKQKSDEANKILRKTARRNKRPFPEKIFMEKQPSSSCGSIWKICSSPKLVVRTIIICLNWLVGMMIFNGLSFNTGNLSGDVFVNFLVITLAEIAGFILSIPLLNRVGRKPVFVGSFVVSGIALTLTIAPVFSTNNDVQWATTCLSLLAKISASMAFGIIFLYSSEFFPTVVRNSVIGICAFCGRMGGLLSPYVSDLGRMVDGPFGKVLPTAVFGIASLITGVLALYLPETRGKELPESIEDTIHYERTRTYVLTVQDPKQNMDQCLSCESVLMTTIEGKNEDDDMIAATNPRTMEERSETEQIDIEHSLKEHT